MAHPQEQPNQIQQQQAQVEIMQHIGPIPDPATLEKYNQVQPGFAERIMIMAEKEQTQRHENDKAIIANYHKQHKRDIDTYRIGQLLAILAVILVIGLSVYYLMLGYATQGTTIAVSVIIGVAAVFVVSDRSKKENKSENTNQ